MLYDCGVNTVTPEYLISSWIYTVAMTIHGTAIKPYTCPITIILHWCHTAMESHSFIIIQWCSHTQCCYLLSVFSVRKTSSTRESREIQLTDFFAHRWWAHRGWVVGIILCWFLSSKATWDAVVTIYFVRRITATSSTLGTAADGLERRPSPLCRLSKDCSLRCRLYSPYHWNSEFI